MIAGRISVRSRSTYSFSGPHRHTEIEGEPASNRCVSDVSRTSTWTAFPSATRRGTSLPPIKPVAPVTRIADNSSLPNFLATVPDEALLREPCDGPRTEIVRNRGMPRRAGKKSFLCGPRAAKASPGSPKRSAIASRSRQRRSPSATCHRRRCSGWSLATTRRRWRPLPRQAWSRSSR